MSNSLYRINAASLRSVSLAVYLLTESVFAAAPQCNLVVGRLASIDGVIEVQRTRDSNWVPATLETILCQGDTVRSGARSRAALTLINETVLRLDQRTSIRLIDIVKEKERRSLLGLLVGAIQSFSRKPRQFEVDTPYLNGVIEGTEFVFRVENRRTLLTVFEGTVTAANKHGSVKVPRGESVVAAEGEPPTARNVVRPRDAAQWALYYPPVLAIVGGQNDNRFAELPAPIREVLRSAGQGNINEAFAALDQIPAADRRSSFFSTRAALLLSVGRLDEALPDVNQALTTDPQDGHALALRAIIHVTQNNKAQALADAKQAVALSPRSAAAMIALSYAQQANFKIVAARDTLLQAVGQQPDDPLVLARLAELWLMLGHRERAVETAQKAVILAPELGRTQITLGFAALAEFRIEQAVVAFERAISLTSSDPMPHLGLGLSKIATGDIESGREEIAIAVGLDSNNALLRAYLGKAYFEEKRSPLDADQFSIAKELDPLDPTPFLYDAIQKQTTNRPVEALHDSQKAIELNDNRAVYRSKLLLDSDLAARSASLGRIYSDLGFQQLALVEGWKSVNTDPSNFSAHRFLSDSYAARPRHEIARVSELLQSQLLQPINTTAIQPRLAESNLFLISAGGPAALSFNEFNPLFNRNGVNFQTSGFGGGNGTWSGEGIVSGIYEKASFSVGYNHFETDGWRNNSDQDDDLANAFVQMEVSPETHIQAEFRYRSTKKGDTALRFFKDDFLPNQRQEDETTSVRLGFHHGFSPSSDLIGNFSYQNADRQLRDQPDDPILRSFDLRGEDGAYGSELQYLFRSDSINLVSGAGYFHIDGKDDINTELTLPFSPDIILSQTTVDLDADHANVYLYSYINLLKNLTVTLGGSGDFFSADDELIKDQNQFNPKVGITWNPFLSTTIRGAAFRVLKRTLITDQTVEPTQVAGFNQFFDEINTTDYWVYGGAIDQKFTENIYAGAQYTYRDLNVPFTAFTGPVPELVDAQWDENKFRAYLFWTPQEWLALSAEWLWERLDRDKDFNLNVKTVETNYVPLGINFFHPSGLSASLKGTYVDQQGSFNRLNAPLGVTEKGQDNFWLFDLAIKYRLPKRYGILTVGVSNLFDEEFQHFDSDIDNPRIQPDRSLFASFTLALP